MKKLNFLYQRKSKVVKLKWKTKFVSMVFVMKANLLILFTYQIKNLQIQWICWYYQIKLNHITCTWKLLTKLRQKQNKNKRYCCKYCLQCFSSERVLVERKKICLNINGQQTVNIKFKIYSSQIPASFKIYADFECILKSVKSSEVFYTEKYQYHIPCRFSWSR